MSDPLRTLVIGAHPDDCDIKAGGCAALWRQHGYVVKFVSVTNGESGHHQKSGQELAALRREEAEAAGNVLGIEYEVLDHRDGHLLPTLEARHSIIGLIRHFDPDLVLTHRPNDYHPDHRYTSQLVCDAAYLVTVPPVVPDVPALRDNPVIMYLSDHFERPYPFSPTVVVDIEPVLEKVVDMLDCHRSQFYEWLAYNHRYEDDLPTDPAARRVWLDERFRQRIAPLADRHRDLVQATYGEKPGRGVRYIEAFEPCEYGSRLTEEGRRRLFPFLP
ncbi:MAG: PIG-L deacetylase family protein [Planctomycetaceae bacterium]